MKRHRLLVAAALLGLSAPFLATSTSSPAQAQVGNGPYRSDHRGDDHDRGNYPRFPRANAMRRVAFLAQSVEGSAVRLERNTFSRRSALNGQERRAMSQIHALTVAASRFRTQVQSFRRDPSHTEADFDRLVRAFYVAGRVLDEVEASGSARTSYNSLSERMDELMRSYGGATRWSQYSYTPRSNPGPHRSGPPSHGSYDR